MSKNPLSGLQIRRAVVRSPDLGFIVAGDPKLDADEVDHTIQFKWKAGVFTKATAKFAAYTLCVVDDPQIAIVKVSASGAYSVQTGKGVTTGNLFRESKPARKRRLSGDIFSLSAIGGKAFAVGFDGEVFRLDGLDSWAWLGESLPSSFDIEAIDGFGVDDLYAVGMHGAVYRFDGARWTHADVPTNRTLTSVCCAVDGRVWIAGHKGLLLEGYESRWSVIDLEDFDKDIWSVLWFQGSLYVSTLSGLYRLVDGRLVPVDFGDDPPRTTNRLTATAEVLWSVGSEDILSFNGKTWTRIVP